jgi:Xaa-Pro dipeptidase
MRHAFPESEYLANLALVRRDLGAKGLGAVAIFDPESIYWLTGYRSIGYFTFQCALVFPDGGPVLVSRRVNQAVAIGNENVAGFVPIEDTDDAVAILAGHLREKLPGGDAIGFETGSWYLTVQAWKQLTRTLPHDLVDWGGPIENARKTRPLPSSLHAPGRAGGRRRAGTAAVKAIAPGERENDRCGSHAS